jgi:hypothetical protein
MYIDTQHDRYLYLIIKKIRLLVRPSLIALRVAENYLTATDKLHTTSSLHDFIPLTRPSQAFLSPQRGRSPASLWIPAFQFCVRHRGSANPCLLLVARCPPPNALTRLPPPNDHLGIHHHSRESTAPVRDSAAASQMHRHDLSPGIQPAPTSSYDPAPKY